MPGPDIFLAAVRRFLMKMHISGQLVKQRKGVLSAMGAIKEKRELVECKEDGRSGCSCGSYVVYSALARLGGVGCTTI